MKSIRKMIVLLITCLAAAGFGLFVCAADMLGVWSAVGLFVCTGWLWCFCKANGLAS